MNDVKFKPVKNDVLFVDAPSFESLMPEGSLARIVNNFVENLQFDDVLNSYKIMGQNSYSPSGMLKAILFAYANNIYSVREIVTFMGHDLRMAYFLGYVRPNHNTINAFRSRRLGNDYVLMVFADLATRLMVDGLVDIVKFDNGRKAERRLMMMWRQRPRKISRTKKERAVQSRLVARLVAQISAATVR
ncbi:MAG: transposase [Muribaculaceae bacterium]|nr:transposase [Muribaculaceae bacterium]